MDVFLCPARYRPFIEQSLRNMQRAIDFDMQVRDDADPVVSRLANLPATDLDDRETGTLLVAVTVPNELELPARRSA